MSNPQKLELCFSVEKKKKKDLPNLLLLNVCHLSGHDFSDIMKSVFFFFQSLKNPHSCIILDTGLMLSSV